MTESTEASVLAVGDSLARPATQELRQVGVTSRQMPDGSSVLYFPDPEAHHNFVNYLKRVFKAEPR
jgi:hypothetical protein